MKRLKLLAASALMALSLTACGSVGGNSVAGSGSADSGATNTTDTVISGMASKGPIITGTIGFYALNAEGGKGSLLKSGTISSGVYTGQNIGKYAGPVLIEVTGNYTDEATGQINAITADAPLRAALSNAPGTAVNSAVTPLTDLAVRQAGALTPSAIDAGNKLISDIFKVDIIRTLPVAPTSEAIKAANQSQRDYTLALAVISQLAKERNDTSISITLDSMANGISSSGMTGSMAQSIQDAADKFMTNVDNKTGVNDKSTTNLAAINGGTTATYLISISPSSVDSPIAANSIKSMQFEIVIPDGLTVRSDAASGTLPGIVTISPSASVDLFDATFTKSTGVGVLGIGLVSNTGIGSGDLATITCDIMPGWPTPSASAFSVRNINALDVNGAPLSSLVKISR